MLELAGDDDIAPCASCAFKQAENRQDFKRKRVRSFKHKKKAKRQKRDKKLVWQHLLHYKHVHTCIHVLEI